MRGWPESRETTWLLRIRIPFVSHQLAAPKSVGFHGQSSRKWRVDFRAKQRERPGAGPHQIYGGMGMGEEKRQLMLREVLVYSEQRQCMNWIS